MKYNPGDKVKIKTWEKMEKEYGLSDFGSINSYRCFISDMEERINKNSPDRILTIEKVTKSGYLMRAMSCSWSDNMIECLASDYKEPIYKPITSRWELLDL